MRILYIDTSSSYLYTAIVDNDNVVAEIKEEYGQSLSEVALPRIASMFEDNKLDPKDLTSLMYQWAINRYIKIFAEADPEHCQRSKAAWDGRAGAAQRP